MQLSVQPKISVILPVYNAENFLKEAVESVLSQSLTDFELLLINDGSTDKSKEIIFSFDDKRIKYIENEKNLGLIKTLNKGIKLSKGKYIARMDSDDVCLPTRFFEQYQFLEKNLNVGLCGTWAKIINNEDAVIGKIVNQIYPEFIKVNLLFSIPIIHPSVMIRANLLKENYYHEVLLAEDYDLWCRLSEKTQLANMTIFSLNYRWHNTNISQQKTEIQEKSKDEIIKRELLKLGLTPDVEQLRIHKLSFSLYFGGNKRNTNKVSNDDLQQTDWWFKLLITQNEQINIYNHYALVSFLWCRWIILCVFSKQKKKFFSPSFISFHPKVLYYLLKQLQLAKKK